MSRADLAEIRRQISAGTRRPAHVCRAVCGSSFEEAGRFQVELQFWFLFGVDPASELLPVLEADMRRFFYEAHKRAQRVIEEKCGKGFLSPGECEAFGRQSLREAQDMAAWFYRHGPAVCGGSRERAAYWREVGGWFGQVQEAMARA